MSCNYWRYHLQVLFGVNQRLRVEDVDSPLVNIRPVKSVLLVIVTGDRGLCGGYNNFVLKKVGQSCRTLLPEHVHVQTAAVPPLMHHPCIQNACAKFLHAPSKSAFYASSGGAAQ